MILNLFFYTYIIYLLPSTSQLRIRHLYHIFHCPYNLLIRAATFHHIPNINLSIASLQQLTRDETTRPRYLITQHLILRIEIFIFFRCHIVFCLILYTFKNFAKIVIFSFNARKTFIFLKIIFEIWITH